MRKSMHVVIDNVTASSAANLGERRELQGAFLLHRPSAERGSDPMERDMREQAEWLAKKAATRGYADIDEMLASAPEVFARLAVQWRRTHRLAAAA